MTTIETIATHLDFSVMVVAGYHFWTSRRKPAVFPATPPAPASAPVPAPAVPALVPAPVAPAPAVFRASVPVPVEQPASVTSTPPEIIAAIAAAVTVVFGPHRVLAVQQAATPSREVNAWALEGRMEHFLSHKIR